MVFSSPCKWQLFTDPGSKTCFSIFICLLQNWVCPDRSLLFFFFRLPQFFVVHHLSSTNVHGFIAHLFWLDHVFMGIQGYTPQCHPHQGNRVLLGDYSGTMMLNTPWTRPYFRGDTLMYIPIMVSCKSTKNSPGCGCLGYIGDRLLLLLGFWNCPLCHSRFSWLVVRVGVCNSRHIDSKCLVVGILCVSSSSPAKYHDNILTEQTW